MRDSGCERIFLGVEAGTDRMQEIVRKRLKLEKLDEVARTLVEMDYKAVLSFIVGFPEETESDIEALWNLVFHLKSVDSDRLRVQVHSLAPELGSSMYETWKDRLCFDEFGTPGHTDFPSLDWIDMEETVKFHPDIFATYHYYDTQSTPRLNALKYAFLNRILEKGATNSLLEAYSVFGVELSRLIVQNVEFLNLSGPGSNYPSLAESVREIIMESLQNNQTALRRYDAISQYEIAADEILKRKPDPHLEVIETYYNPIDFIENSKNEPEERKRFIAITWDEDEETIVSKEASHSIANLVWKSSRQ
jgi:hypothetical protein